MKKTKKIGALLAASILSLGVGAFVACGDGDNTGNNDNVAKDAYTLVVKDAQGNAMEGVRIGICVYTKNGFCLNLETTDANGKVVFDKADGVEDGKTYTLNSLSPILTNYSAQENYVFESYGEYTVVLIAK